MDFEGDLDPGYEPEVTGIARRFVRPGQVCVDAGASIGYYTCLFSQLVGPKGLVLAFEPNAASFRYLEANVAARGLKNVFVWPEALWSCDLAELKLHSVDRLGYTSVLHYATTTYTEVVGARALDGLLPPGVEPDFIKIDCEMAEFQILQGAQRALARGVDCVILEFNYNLMRQNGVSDHTIRDFMHDLGYNMFIISIGSPERGYEDPIMVSPAVDIQVHGKLTNVNVMFSTEEKVRELWKICATSPSSQRLTESYRHSLLSITENAVE